MEGRGAEQQLSALHPSECSRAGPSKETNTAGSALAARWERSASHGQGRQPGSSGYQRHSAAHLSGESFTQGIRANPASIMTSNAHPCSLFADMLAEKPTTSQLQSDVSAG